jgi:hypothetical protein
MIIFVSTIAVNTIAINTIAIKTKGFREKFEISSRRFEVGRVSSSNLESISFQVNQLVKHRYILDLSVLTYIKNIVFWKLIINHSLWFMYCQLTKKTMVYLVNRGFKFTPRESSVSFKL